MKVFRIFSVGLPVLGLFFLTYCDNSEQIGLGITPPNERFRYQIDSSSRVEMFTLRQDSLTSEKRTSSLLGSMQDPLFGRSDAGILTQLRLSSNEVNFGDEVGLDSVVLLLKYKTAYGDTTTLQHLKVFELTKDLYFDSTYYSNLKKEEYFHDQNPVGEISYLPRPSHDSLTIRLSDVIGYKLLLADTASLSNNSLFLEYFKGLAIMPEPVATGGCLVSFNLSGGKSRMVVYYHNAVEDSLKYEVVINANSTWLNVFDHDYQGSEVQPCINDSTTVSGRVYLQAMSGLRGHLKFRLTDSLLLQAEHGISINKAELILPVDEDPTEPGFIRPKQLRLFASLEDGTNDFVSDIFLGEEYFGGRYDAQTGTYSFNIGRHIQELLHPTADRRLVDRGLFVTINDDRITANRVVIKNSNREDGIRLIITYTRIR